jgi:DNA invertase Pin-like site-specific DNA recombinase
MGRTRPPRAAGLVLTALGGLAEFERELIRARTADGRDSAKACGVHIGRPLKLKPHQQREAQQRRANGGTLVDSARTFDVTHPTISRLLALTSTRRLDKARFRIQSPKPLVALVKFQCITTISPVTISGVGV